MVAAIRDRQRRDGVAQPPPPPQPKRRSERSEFAAAAAQVGQDIYATAERLGRLTQLAQSKSLFEDPTVEINELTRIVKQDITALNSKLGGLQTLMANQASSSKQSATHSKTVVEVLKTRLIDATRSFHDVLQTRSNNVQQLQARRAQLQAAPVASGACAGCASGSAPGGGGSSSAAPTGAGSFGGGRHAPPSPAPTSIFELAPPTSGDGGGEGSGAVWANPSSRPVGLRPVDEGGGEVVIDMGDAQEQQQLTPAHQYLDSRAQAVESVQSTIVELGGIFQQLAVMVQEQGSMMQRIDENVDDSLVSVSEGHAQLQRYWQGMSSNRGLAMKVFAVLMFFIVMWGAFLA